MADMKVPGIYISEQQYRLNPLQIDTRCLAGFAGISERGPVDTPVMIRSFDEYLAAFGGFDTEGMLPGCVYSYFKCGGKECVVVRVADKNAAAPASATVAAGSGHIRFTARSPGCWGNGMTVSVWWEKDGFFSVSLSCKGKSESHLHLSTDEADSRYFAVYINARSSLCTAEKDGDVGVPESVMLKNFSGGLDGIESLTAGDYIGRYDGLNNYAGIGCFESRNDISLIAVPDVCRLKSRADIVVVQEVLVRQAERFQGRFAVLDVPEGLDVVDASAWARRMDSSFAAAYYPFIDMIDPLDPVGANTMRIPPSGAVCGCIAATDGEKGVFAAPANCLLEGAVGISASTTTSEQELLYGSGINVLRYFPGRGVKVWGARTLSSDKEWKHINVRRTFSRVCAALKQGTQWAVFEPNDKNLRKRLVRQVSGFLLDLWMKGYFAGSTAEQGFYVRCDEELNPPENIDNGILTFEVGVAIVRPVEFFRITLTAEKDGASVYIQESR